MSTVRLDREFEVGKAWFMVMEGVVHDYQFNAWASTRVVSSGGGGYVGSSGGHVSAPSVSSSTTQHKRTSFWINDGVTDQNVVLNNEFPVANNQRASLLWGGAVGAKTGDYLLLRNNTTGYHYHYKSDKDLFKWAASNKLVKRSNAFIFLVIGVVLTFFAFSAHLLGATTLLLLACLTVIVPIVVSQKHREQRVREIKKELLSVLER